MECSNSSKSNPTKVNCKKRIQLQSSLIACLALLTVPAVGMAAMGSQRTEVASVPDDLTALSLDQLLNIEITSVSRLAEPASSAAAAIYVLTGAEIRRSGARSISEALRLVPGMNVAQTSATHYAISARGFNSGAADKLEVLLDGRSVYSPLLSSVFWDVLDTYMPDISRIEVIRGPGAALWGSNAVNGVINIITKSAKDTHGVSAHASAGTVDPYDVGARLGLQLGQGGSLRLYAQGHARGDEEFSNGSDARDGSRIVQAGFRSDWNLAGNHDLTVSGDTYQATERSATITATGPDGPVEDVPRSGGNLLVRWECCGQEDGRWSMQGSYDTYHLFQPTVLEERRRTVALEFQQQWLLDQHNTLLYGLSWKNSRDETGGPPLVALFVPASRTLDSYSGFVQDQLKFLDDAATLTIGSKFERNSLSGFEVQPSVRLGWQASPKIFSWAAISRAVRTPNRINQDVAINCGPGIPGLCGPGLFRVGNPDIDSEKIIAYEWGLRLRSTERLSWDLATYYNDYSSLISSESAPPFGAYDNKLKAKGYGAELNLIWQATNRLELRPFYSLQVLDARPAAGSTDTSTAATLEGSSPRHQAGLKAYYTPAPRWAVDGFLRYVDTLAQSGVVSASSGTTRVPAYVDLSLRLGYTLVPGLELNLTGQNLLDSQHPEFGGVNTRSELSRSLLLEVRWDLQ